ncbi:MAG: hypothetical protein ABSA08_04720 [Acidimicrobiales bacterium]|jgi:hypothetical protein
MPHSEPPDRGTTGGAGDGDAGEGPRIWVEPQSPRKRREIPVFEPGARVIPPMSVEAAGQGVPYLPAPPTPPVTRATFGFGWLLVLMACGGAMIAGSFYAWLTVHGHSASGMSPAVSIGNVSNIAGCVLVCSALVFAMARHTVFGDLVSQLMPAAAGAGLAATIFWLWSMSLFTHLHRVGWGVYVVVAASLVALAVSTKVNRT